MLKYGGGQYQVNAGLSQWEITDVADNVNILAMR
jgi:hypothetical protein